MENKSNIEAKGYTPTKLPDWLRMHFNPTIVVRWNSTVDITQELRLSVDLLPFDDDAMTVLNSITSDSLLRLGPVDPAAYDQEHLDGTGVDEYVIGVGDLLGHACQFVRDRSLMRSSNGVDILTEAMTEVQRSMNLPEYRINVLKSLVELNKRFRVRTDRLVRSEGGMENFADKYVDDLRRRVATSVSEQSNE